MVCVCVGGGGPQVGLNSVRGAQVGLYGIEGITGSTLCFRGDHM